MQYRCRHETKLLNNIPALSVAFGAGFFANIIGERDSKTSRIANGVALTVLFGVQTLCLIGILLNNTVYYEGSFDKCDGLHLRYQLPLDLWRLVCYYLGCNAARDLQDLEEEAKKSAEKSI